jgi:hypothetical protein
MSVVNFRSLCVLRGTAGVLAIGIKHTEPEIVTGPGSKNDALHAHSVT